MSKCSESQNTDKLFFPLYPSKTQIELDLTFIANIPSNTTEVPLIIQEYEEV